MNNSKLHPLLLLSTTILLPFVISVFDSLLMIISIQLVGVILLCLYKRVKRACKMTAVFIVIYILYNTALHSSSIHAFAYLGMFTFVILRIIPPMMIASLLLYDMETGELLAALNQARLPKKLMIGCTVAIRFLPSVQNEIHIIRQALKMRRVKLSISRPLEMMEYLLVPVLFRTQIISEEMTANAITKGAQCPDRRTSIYSLRWNWMNTLFVAALSTTIFICIGMGGNG